jgi:hypothetical protein
MKSVFDEIRPDEYSVAAEAQIIGEKLIAAVPEHEHLQPAIIGYVFRDDELKRHGKVILAECILVERILQSDKRYSRIVKWALLRILETGELPDFLVLIDRNIWDGLDIASRVALIDHELSHAWFATDEDGETQKFHQDGSPIWAIRGHDVEEFCGVIQRRGLWSPELTEMARVIVDTLSAEQERRTA